MYIAKARPKWASPLRFFIAGLASTTVGSYSGTVILNGLLHVHVSALGSRLITAVPAIIFLAAGVEATHLLIISRVVLSFGIPLVLIPFVSISANRFIMGRALPRSVLVLASGCAVIIVGLNISLLVATSAGSGS